jgi:peptidoglycan/xylan/chitin deacetylase (PgdA/CDA1 family)
MLSLLATEICAGLGATAGLGLTAGGYAYAAQWPGSKIFGEAMIAPKSPGEAALTFDDGPNPLWTPRLLDLLAHYKVQATFFMMGSHAQSVPDLVRRVAAAGHLIGSHSWSHPNLAYTRATRVREELTRSKEAIEQITGAPVTFFRPPFGARRPYVLRAARELGLTPVLWNAMTTDWKEPSAEKIAARLMQKINRLGQQGWAANIVLHDGNNLDPVADRRASATAAEILLLHYAKTRRFVTLSEWR